MPVPDIFVDMDSVVFIQEDGPGSAYAAMPCHAIDSTSIGRADPARVYCKDPGRRGERVIARTVPGRKEDGTLTINAWSQHQSDLLHRLWQRNCMFGVQTHLDVCGLPTDVNAYTKLLDYYGIMPGSLDYANVDALEGGDGTGLQVSLSCTYADLLEVLQVELAEEAGVGVAGNTMTCVYGDIREMCLDDCGVDMRRCDIVMIASDENAGAPAPPVVWYYDATDAVPAWAGTVGAPWAGNIPISTCAITGDRWYVFLGAIAGAGNPAICIYTDLQGAAGSWVPVEMGGVDNVDYITNSYVHDAGNIFACGGEATPTGAAYHSHDMGVSWTRILLPGAQIAQDIATADGDVVYVVKNANLMDVSYDGGHTFAAVAGPAVGGATNLTAVRALTPAHVIVGAVVDPGIGQLWQSFDYGANWFVIPFAGHLTANSQVWSLSIVPTAFRQHLFMVQGLTGTPNTRECFRSLDGGATWTAVTQLANQGYNDVFACDSNNAWISEDTGATPGGCFRVSAV